MTIVEKPIPAPTLIRESDELPELPPLDDDGELLGGEDDLVPDHDRGAVGLDDSTSEDEGLDRFGGLDAISDAIADDGSLLEGADASEDLVSDGDEELLAGAEVGLLEDSDEGDGRDEGSDGLVGDEEQGEEDGGAEGTNEDPAAALDAEIERAAAGEASDDEAIDDDARFVDAGAARASLEREPWPPRADVAWSCRRVASPATFAAIEPVTSAGELVVAVSAGALAISTDGGATFAPVPGCKGVTAATIVSSSRPQRAVAAALHDALREASGLVLVRIDDADARSAELVADFVAEDDEPSRVDRLLARITPGGAIELLAWTGDVARLSRPKS